VTALPKVTVISLGGTIASSSQDGGAATVRISGSDLLAAIPQVRQVASLEVRQVNMVPSGDLTLADMFAVRALASAAIDDGCDGIVVTQGTDTLEETSYAMDLLTAWDEPIVFTGAMRNSSLPGADGPANLLAAIQVAASRQARGLGSVVVFNDEIHASRLVRKTHTSSTSTFKSPGAGPLGHVIEDRVRITLRPTGRLHVQVPDDAPEARVAQVSVAFDDDARLIRAIPGLGFDGLILAAFGGGHVPSPVVPALSEVASLIPVIVASRTNSGEGLRNTYGYPGSEVDLLSRGLVPAVSLDAAHAAVLLRLLLMAGVERSSLRGWFEQAGAPDGLAVVPQTVIT
jgi:L-asparaginase